MNVALYLRYSSDAQTEQSIEGQRRVCQEYCQREGHTIVASYIDRATSAFKDTEKRIQFNKMIKDSEKHTFEGVVVYKLDRFSRNRYDSATYKARLKKNGVRVISATENISDNPEGVILEAVLEGMAEFYSLELSQKINRGMRESALKAHSTGGQVPLGLKLVNKEYAIEEKTAPIVREAFEMYASGTSLADICRTLNNRGYRTSKGALFNKNSFKSILKNEKYIGTFTYRDIRIENAFPAIVSRELFEAVQRKLHANGETKGHFKAKTDYLLATKLFCGHCGARMVGDGGVSRHGKTYYYYTCGERKRGNGCEKKSIGKELIETAVAEETVKLLTPELIDWMADLAIEANKADQANNPAETIKAEIKDYETRLNRLLKLAEAGTLPDSAIPRMKELEAIIRDANVRLAEAQADTIVLEKSHIVWFLEQFCNGDIKDEQFKRRLIDLLVNSVTLWDLPDGGYKMTIAYNLTEYPKETYRVSEKGDARIIEKNFHHDSSILNLFSQGFTFGITLIK